MRPLRSGNPWDVRPVLVPRRDVASRQHGIRTVTESRKEQLSARQLEVLMTLAELGSNQAVVDKLGIAEQTVKNHLSQIRLLTDSTSTLQAYHRLFAAVLHDQEVWLKARTIELKDGTLWVSLDDAMEAVRRTRGGV